MKWYRRKDFSTLPKRDFLCTFSKLGTQIYFVKYDLNDNSFWCPEFDDACHNSTVIKEDMEFIYIYPEIKLKQCKCPRELDNE